MLEPLTEALCPTFTVRVTLPPAVTEELESVAVTPLERPESVRLTVPAVPMAVVLMVAVDELPREMMSAFGLAPMVKSPLVEVGLTVRLTDVVCVVPSDVFPVMVMEDVPVAAVEEAVSVSSDEPLPLTGLVPKLAVTPEGSPEAVSVTPELSVPLTVTVMVEVPLLPCVMVTLPGDEERLKLPCCVVPPVSAVIKVGVGLPHPVTRSKPVTAEKLPEVPLVMSWKSAA